MSGNAFNDWMIYGAGAGQLRSSAMAAAHTNEPEGRRYCAEIERDPEGAESRWNRPSRSVPPSESHGEPRPAIEAWRAKTEDRQALEVEPSAGGAQRLGNAPKGQEESPGPSPGARGVRHLEKCGHEGEARRA